jgi:hypothetical protein
MNLDDAKEFDMSSYNTPLPTINFGNSNNKNEKNISYTNSKNSHISYDMNSFADNNKERSIKPIMKPISKPIN